MTSQKLSRRRTELTRGLEQEVRYSLPSDPWAFPISCTPNYLLYGKNSSYPPAFGANEEISPVSRPRGGIRRNRFLYFSPISLICEFEAFLRPGSRAWLG